MKNHSSAKSCLFTSIQYRISSIKYLKNPGPDLACKAWVQRAYLGNTATTTVYSSNVAPGGLDIDVKILSYEDM
jgi:hypothetical protein